MKNNIVSKTLSIALLSACCVLSLQAEPVLNRYELEEFTLKKQETLNNQTNIRSLESLKDEQGKIKEIIVKFEILEDALTGFEDKFIVNKIKQEFIDKYLINNADLLLIKQKINQQLKIKDEPNKDIKIFQER